MKKLLFILLILAVVGASAYSVDFSTHPAPIGRGNVLISPTLHLGTGWLAGVSFGFSVPVDFALPIPVGLMVGLEPGFIFTTGNILGYRWSPNLIPIFTRVSWHPNFEVRGLDPYVVLKLGYSIAFGGRDRLYNYSGKYVGGFSYGGNVGVRYFFNNAIGIYGELGYDRYGYSYRYDYNYYSRWSGYTSTYFHVGATFKIGQSSTVGGRSSGSGGSSSSSGARGNATTTSDVNFRSGPSADSSIIRALPSGTTVALTGETSGGWTQVTYGGQTGWISSQYLR